MSYSTALGIVPGRRPTTLAEFRNAWGWGPSIWDRIMNDLILGKWTDGRAMNYLFTIIESLVEWQQVPLVLTFDTGVIPFQEYEWAAAQLDEFERRLPAPENQVNHVPAVAELLRSQPEVPLFGMWGTSVTTNPFDPWDADADAPGSGIPLAEMYLLPRHRQFVPDPLPRGDLTDAGIVPSSGC